MHDVYADIAEEEENGEIQLETGANAGAQEMNEETIVHESEPTASLPLSEE